MDVKHLPMPFHYTSICFSTKPIALNIKHEAFTKHSSVKLPKKDVWYYIRTKRLGGHSLTVT